MIILILTLSSCSLSIIKHEESKVTALSSKRSTNIQEKQKVSSEFFFRELYIVALGDSLTAGVGDVSNNKGYLAHIKQKLNANPLVDSQIVNYGISGYNTTDLLNKIKTAEVLNDLKKAEIILLTIGGNDLLKTAVDNFPYFSVDVFTKPRQEYEENLQSIINFIRTHNTESHIILVGLYNPFYKWFNNVPEVNDIINGWNQSSEKILAAYDNTHLVKIDDLFLNRQTELLFDDQFHPNHTGYQLISERVYEVLRAEFYLQ
ncbi:GDSL-type esterase/lipase family protein [Bacillus sp. Marseille-P3661]|uniref:GDSL-type esterase/lipase family protein n=1 Tax=Bacillus sp. Marseille-P3661 TaxID=1936234 RepID=UPI0015E1B544|nr:GDSL-type esterase/lipase family protein [Bacillus sp. Marseille-P3661]